jgi:hypothetical protein
MHDSMFYVTEFVSMYLVDCDACADCWAGAMLHDAGIRRLQTADYACLSLALKMQAIKVLKALLIYQSSALPKQLFMKHSA